MRAPAFSSRCQIADMPYPSSSMPGPECHLANGTFGPQIVGHSGVQGAMMIDAPVRQAACALPWKLTTMAAEPGHGRRLTPELRGRDRPRPQHVGTDEVVLELEPLVRQPADGERPRHLETLLRTESFPLRNMEHAHLARVLEGTVRDLALADVEERPIAVPVERDRKLDETRAEDRVGKSGRGGPCSSGMRTSTGIRTRSSRSRCRRGGRSLGGSIGPGWM